MVSGLSFLQSDDVRYLTCNLLVKNLSKAASAGLIYIGRCGVGLLGAYKADRQNNKTYIMDYTQCVVYGLELHDLTLESVPFSYTSCLDTSLTDMADVWTARAKKILDRAFELSA
jgi:hypothetical protein